MEYLSHAFRHAFVWEFWTWIICGIFGVFETCGVVNKLKTCWCRSAGTRTAATLGTATGFWRFPKYSNLSLVQF